MTRQQRRNDGVAGRVQSLTEVAERLRSVARTVQEQQTAAVRAVEPEALRARGDTVVIYGKSRCIIRFDCPTDATPIERCGGECSGRRKENEGNQLKPLTLAPSVASHRWIDLETPSVDSANEVAHLSEPLVAKPVHGSLTACPMVTIDDHLDVPVERVHGLRQ